MTKANFKNSLIALAIGMVMVSCNSGGSKQNAAQSGDSEKTTEAVAPAKNSNKLFDVDFNEVDIPVVAKKGIGTLNAAYENKGSVFFKLKDVDEKDFNTLIDYYKAKGGVLDESYSTKVEKRFAFDWGQITATHFGFDKECSIEITQK